MHRLLHLPVTPRRWRRTRFFVACLLGTVTTSAGAANVNVLVGSGGLFFEPSSVTISPGDTVTFRNSGGLHNAVADNGSFRCANGCDGSGGNGTPSLALWHATVTFTTPGSFGYFCEQHGDATTGMRGLITVRDTSPVTLQSFEVD